MELKIYKAQIDPAITSDLEVNFIGLVDRPAIERNFHAFREQQQRAAFVLNEEKRIISGPAMIADDAFIPFDKQSLGKMRRQLAGEARNCGLDETRIPDLLLAVNEIATNSILYAGAGSLGVWQEDGRIVCEVRDEGFIDDDLVGRLRPAITEEQGRGIWFAHQVADLLQFRSAPSGTQWRIIFDCGSPR